ncbi:MAG: RNA polymerase sigma factor [Chitinophagaceae bacterium]|jgi:RNA polymerase sigma factor (sigma-70 family)|nr:RNA polymerase sigma factor [Chitinophagaceae bacterium]
MTEREYNQCVDQYADGVYRFILKNMQVPEDAQDVVQSAFEKMWKNHQDVKIETAKAYLFTVAYNQMIDHIRKNKRMTLVDEFSESSKISWSRQTNLKQELERALQQLTPLQKSLILLKDYEGYSYDEIGKITSLNASQVKVYLHRARMQMKEYIGKIENLI